MQHLQVLVSTIGSGKSTYSKNAARAGMIVVNDDAFTNALHSDQYQLYDSSLTPLYKQVETVAAYSALALGRSVVVDRGRNLKANSRRRWIGIGHSLDIPVVALCFRMESANVHASRRYFSDSRGASLEQWERIAERHLSEYERPTIAEGFAKVVDVEWEKVRDGWHWSFN